MLYSFILSLLLICSPFYSIQIYFISNWFDSIRVESSRVDWVGFYWFRFTILLRIVPHNNERFVSICLPVCLSVRPSLCLSVWTSFCFLFFFHLFSPSFRFLLSFVMNVFLTHTYGYTHTRTHTHTYEYLFLLMNRIYFFKSM